MKKHTIRLFILIGLISISTSQFAYAAKGGAGNKGGADKGRCCAKHSDSERGEGRQGEQDKSNVDRAGHHNAGKFADRAGHHKGSRMAENNGEDSDEGPRCKGKKKGKGKRPGKPGKKAHDDNGHGNDADGHDESNPGKSRGVFR